MVIAIDGRELLGRPTGVGRYLSALLDVWGRLPEAAAHEFVVYLPDAPDDGPAAGAALLPSATGRFDVRRVPGRAGTVWEQVRLARRLHRDRPDVLFAPAYSAPLRARMPVALAVHDVSFAARPGWYTWREGLRRRALTRWSARRAAVVLTISRFSQQEIARRFGIPCDRILTIPPGVCSPAVPPARGRPRDPVVLFVGSIFNRRNLPMLIDAFARVLPHQPHARLVIAGENRTHPRQDLEAIAAAAGIRSSVELRAYVDEATLAELYGRASVFAFLSEYEGFGLPPLEALAAGVPVVVLDTPVARETCADAARFVRPGDVAGTAAAIRTLLEDERARQAILDRAAAVLARYSWNGAARATLAAIERAAG